MSQKIILLHGALGSIDQLEILKFELSDSYEVLTFNFNGHGDNSINSLFSIEVFTDNILDFLNENGIDSVSIFGYSMGGYVALNFALRYPDRIKNIITLGTKLEWNAETSIKEVRKLNADKIEEKVPAFAKTLKGIHTGIGWRDVLYKTAQFMTDLGNGGGLSENDFSSISCPVCLMIGDKDEMVSLDETKHVAQQLQAGEILILPNCKHPIQGVDASYLKSKIATFFN